MLKVGECKALARRTLLGRYGTVIAAYFITIGITFLMWSLTIASGCATLFGAGVVGTMLGGAAAFSFPKLVGGVMLTMFLLLASIFVSLWLEIGSTRLMLNICRGLKYGVSDVFYGFRKGSNTLRFVCIGVVLGLINVAINLIQKLLFTLAGFIFADAGLLRLVVMVLITIVTLLISWYISVSFMFAKIIIADQRETGISRALSTSHKLMKGRKLKGFWLMYFSFLFWCLLMFVCGPASLWIAPYIACTTVIFYMDADGTIWQLTDAGMPKTDESQNTESQVHEPLTDEPQVHEPEVSEAEVHAYADEDANTAADAGNAAETATGTMAAAASVAEGAETNASVDKNVDESISVSVSESAEEGEAKMAADASPSAAHVSFEQAASEMNISVPTAERADDKVAATDAETANNAAAVADTETATDTNTNTNTEDETGV